MYEYDRLLCGTDFVRGRRHSAQGTTKPASDPRQHLHVGCDRTCRSNNLNVKSGEDCRTSLLADMRYEARYNGICMAN